MFVTSLLLQRETGGNLSELLNTISALIRQRLQLRGQLQTLTAEPKMSAQLLAAMPRVSTLPFRFWALMKAFCPVPELRACVSTSELTEYSTSCLRSTDLAASLT